MSDVLRFALFNDMSLIFLGTSNFAWGRCMDTLAARFLLNALADTSRQILRPLMAPRVQLTFEAMSRFTFSGVIFSLEFALKRQRSLSQGSTSLEYLFQ